MIIEDKHRLLVDMIVFACNVRSRPSLARHLAGCPGCQVRVIERVETYSLTELFEEWFQVLGGSYDCRCCQLSLRCSLYFLCTVSRHSDEVIERGDLPGLASIHSSHSFNTPYDVSWMVHELNDQISSPLTRNK